MEVVLKWHQHKYFPYEKEIALREINTLINPTTLEVNGDEVVLNGKFDKELLEKLVYFSEYYCEDSSIETLQAKLERSCNKSGNKKRQSTRYSVHGLHEYKGKFNPQIVRGVLNMLGTKPGENLIDPFCGSGTTLIESTYSGVRSVGIDLNPLAVEISNAKILSLSSPHKGLTMAWHKIISSYKEISQLNEDDQYLNYLRDWFDHENLVVIESLRTAIVSSAGKYSDIFLALASDLLRDYSLQEPADLRVRRRKSPYPEVSFMDAYKQKVSSFLGNVKSSQEVTGKQARIGKAYNIDSRDRKRIRNTFHEDEFDVSITSPPYATALPYIDTQRLSLVWMRKLDKSGFKKLESMMTGSREMRKEEKDKFTESFESNLFGLSPNVFDFCVHLKESLSDSDGFRRKAVPLLMYRYFNDMKLMFQTMKHPMKKGALFALVVGHNKTTLGGNKIDIDTPHYLKEVAIDVGWKHVESFPLQTYHRYDLHSQNAVNDETLLILQNA